MSLKAFFLFLAASAIAFAVQSGARGERTTTLENSVGAPIVTTRL